MKRLVMAAALIAAVACGRPGDDDEYEETVYDANNPPIVRDTGVARANPMMRDTLTMRLDSIRTDSLRRDSLQRGLIRDTLVRDTMP